MTFYEFCINLYEEPDSPCYGITIANSMGEAVNKITKAFVLQEDGINNIQIALLAKYKRRYYYTG